MTLQPVHAATVLTPVAAMLAVGFWGLNRGSMWQDEEATYNAAGRTLGQLWALVHHYDVVHFAYYLFMHAWLSAGGGEVWLRVPSVLAAAASAGLVAAIGRRLAGDRAGMLAGLLFACLPFVSFYAQEGRSFALVAAFVLLGSYCLVRAYPLTLARTGAARWWIGYLVSMGVAAVLHEFAVLVFVGHALTLLVSRAPWRVWWRAGICAVLCGIAVLPLVVESRRQSGQVSWLTAPDGSTMVDFARSLTGTTPVAMAIFVLLALVGLGVARLPTARLSAAAGEPNFRFAALAVPLLLVPPAILVAASFIQPLFVDRYVLYSAAGIPLLAGAGLDRIVSLLRRSALCWAVGVLLVAAVFVIQLPAMRDVRSVDSRSDDLAAAAQIVARGARPGDGVLFMPSKYRAAALAYPSAFAGLKDVSIDESPVEAENLRGKDKSRRQTTKIMLATDRIWVIGRSGLKVGSNEKGAVNERNTLRSGFRLMSKSDVHGLEVALYTRRG